MVCIVMSFAGSKEEVLVQLNLLRSSSEFFQSATKPEWNRLRDQPNTINVEAEPGVFKAYLHWLYTSTIASPSPDPDSTDVWYPFLAKLYVLGEELIDIRFKNCILDTFVTVAREARWYPTGHPIAIIYAGTPMNSPARRLMIDFFAYEAHSNDDSWTKQLQDCPKEFVLDALVAIIKLRKGPTGAPRPWDQSQIAYHESE
jgi:hypothetical protein